MSFRSGAGLTVDFGKWASSLGIEGNYTKDQLNYSRSFWFDYLPFYHMGFRAKYAVNDQFAVNLWITNGTEQTEAFNNYKDQLLGVVLTPIPAISWTLNLYKGQEHPDVVYLMNPAPGQTQTCRVSRAPTSCRSRTRQPASSIFVDSYVCWQAIQALTLAAEADYVQNRLYSYSSPEHVAGGALYGGYQLTPAVAVALRLEYLADVGGLYTGATQYLKEGTFTVDYKLAERFLDSRRVPPRPVEPALLLDQCSGGFGFIAADHRPGARLVVRTEGRRLVGRRELRAQRRAQAMPAMVSITARKIYKIFMPEPLRFAFRALADGASDRADPVRVSPYSHAERRC